MLRSLRLVPMLLVLLLMAFPTLAWGPEGHAIVADIAQQHLTPSAMREVQYLLSLRGNNRLDQIASLPDGLRGTQRQTGPWHYVDIPLNASGYKITRDCPQGNCSVARLPFFVHELADQKNAPRVRLRALIWVVHLMGDIHQPLHNEDDHDKGGNDVKLTYFGEPTNLHRVWDSGIIQHALGVRANRDYTIDFTATRAAAMKLDQSITSTDRAHWTPAHPLAGISAEAVRWAEQEHLLARKVAYGNLPPARERRDGSHWSTTYQQKAWPVVRDQLQAAGIRLAAILNAALGDEPAAGTPAAFGNGS